jgi:hypothetical protein
MNIYDFADIIDKDIIIRRYSNQDNGFMAEFENAETKNNKSSCVLEGSYGNGESPEEAIIDYSKKIQGRVLVFDSMGKDRQEYVVPNCLLKED